MNKSKIEWTNITWNPVTGCAPISEGCQNCYAARMHKRLQAMGQEKYKDGFNVVTFHDSEYYRDFSKKPKMIFVNSMSDTFHEDLYSEEIEIIFIKIRENKQHIFQVLTKRSERLQFFNYPENVWLGVTVELAKYKNRIDDLRKTNAKIKFLSCEPLLGDLGELDLTGIDWVIVGGESGPGARPMHPMWVKNIQKQCQEQGVKFFFKQWGEWSDQCPDGYEKKPSAILHFDGTIYEGRFLKYYRDIWMFKIGKKKAGRELDGQVWDQMPI